jgi:hypothetical protein
MNRASFFAGAAAFAALGAAPGPPAFASTLAGTTTQGDLFAGLPHGRPGQWTRVILGSGAMYQKQIGLGTEIDRAGESRLYIETQVGMPGGSCNPSSMRKAYLRDAAFGSILHGYSLLANVGRTENMVYRYGDGPSGENGKSADSILHLLDEPWLYDARPLHVLSATRERIHAASAMHETTHVVAEFSRPRSAKERLERIELWHSPDFPFGVARYRATLRGLEPFELHVYSHGAEFTSLLAMSLDEVREITKNGEYGQLPASI